MRFLFIILRICRVKLFYHAIMQIKTLERRQEIIGESQYQSKIRSKLLEWSHDISSFISGTFLSLFLCVWKYKDCMVKFRSIMTDCTSITRGSSLWKLEFCIEKREIIPCQWRIVYKAVLQVDWILFYFIQRVVRQLTWKVYPECFSRVLQIWVMWFWHEKLSYLLHYEDSIFNSCLFCIQITYTCLPRVLL